MSSGRTRGRRPSRPCGDSRGSGPRRAASTPRDAVITPRASVAAGAHPASGIPHRVEFVVLSNRGLADARPTNPLRTCQVLRRAYFFFLATFFLATFFLATFFFAAISDHLLGSDLGGGVPNLRWDTVGRRLGRGPGGPAELPRTPLGLVRVGKQVPFHSLGTGPDSIHNVMGRMTIKIEPRIRPGLQFLGFHCGEAF